MRPHVPFPAVQAIWLWRTDGTTADLTKGPRGTCACQHQMQCAPTPDCCNCILLKCAAIRLRIKLSSIDLVSKQALVPQPPLSSALNGKQQML